MLDINNMSIKEIEGNLDETLEAYANLRFQKATHQLDNPVKLRYLRKDIARLKTVLREYKQGIRTSKEAGKEKKGPKKDTQ